MTRTNMINYLIQKHNFKTYLEIGLDNPDINYNHIICNNKETCDPYMNDDWDGNYDRNNLPDNIKDILTYHMTSDEMFKINNKKYDIIFIDGYHEQMQVGRDIINSLKHLNKGGFIIVHDCLPHSEDAQIMPRQQSEWNGDVWKAIPKLNKQNIKYDVVDTDYGCGIISYRENADELYEITEKSTLDYNNDFVPNRNTLMHVISEEEFKVKY